MRRALFIVMAVVIAGCGGQELDRPDFEKMRAGGKADGWVDTSLSCQGSCGSIATGFTGYCGCDDKCATYGDCCSDKAAVCDGTTPGKDCNDIEQDWQQALQTAAGCTADSDCDKFVGGSLSCGIPLKAVNTALASQLDTVKQDWQAAKCDQQPWVCPMLAPLPPWMGTRGVCEQGSCKVEYYDTRGAKEGEGCGDDINTRCAKGLYCAFGLNWCGTPPVVGVCRKMGECGAASDCDNQDNLWMRPMCMGQTTCNQGVCGVSCGL